MDGLPAPDPATLRDGVVVAIEHFQTIRQQKLAEIAKLRQQIQQLVNDIAQVDECLAAQYRNQIKAEPEAEKAE